MKQQQHNQMVTYAQFHVAEDVGPVIEKMCGMLYYCIQLEHQWSVISACVLQLCHASISQQPHLG